MACGLKSRPSRNEVKTVPIPLRLAINWVKLGIKEETICQVKDILQTSSNKSKVTYRNLLKVSSTKKRNCNLTCSLG